MVQTYVSSKILSVGLDLPCHSHMARAERWATGDGSSLNLTKTHNILAGQKGALPPLPLACASSTARKAWARASSALAKTLFATSFQDRVVDASTYKP